jgi:hypothetical protein
MQHILDVQFPDENPKGAPGGDYQQISTNPSMFGATTARVLSTFGEGLEHAGNTAIDAATLQAKQDDHTHANELHSWHSDRVTDAQEQFNTLRGKDAEMALPAFKQQIDDFRRQAVVQAGNPYTAQLVDDEGRKLTDTAYAQAARRAASQKTSWDTNTADDAAASHGSRAAIGASTTPSDVPLNANPSVVLSLGKSDDAARHAAQLKGLDGDIEAQRNRGKNVAEIIKSTIADGSYSSFNRAREFFHSQYDRMDGGSIATIEQSLKGIAANFDGQRTADIYMGRGPGLPAGYAQRTFQIESGGNPNAVTGSNRGLGQFSKGLEVRYGINDTNRTDPIVQAKALGQENQENHDALARSLGHEPTPADYYLAHQQGIGGAVAHISQPNLPAWQNMYGTVEGREKGQGWAKAAIWGNMTPDMKAQFPGGVDTVTSGDFARMWAQRFYQQPIQALGTVPGNGMQAPDALPAAMPFNRFQGAQDFSETNKGDVLSRIHNDPYLLDHPQAMNAAITYTNKIFEAQSGSYADMERQHHIIQQQRAMISDDAENDYMKQIYAPTVNAKPLSVQNIVLDDRLSRESKDRIIKLIKDPGEKDDKTYGQGFVQSFQMVHAPEGTPGRITDPKQLYDQLGKDGGLTFAGVEKLRSEINLKQTPEGAAEGEMKKAFLKNAQAQITGTDEGLHIKDPKGDQLYLQFMAQALPRYEQGRKEGKSPSQLLDPTSTDYIGKGLIDQPGHGFRRPMTEWFNDTIHDTPPPAASAKPAFVISKVKSLDDLVTAFKNGDVTPQQAREYALANGWASRKPKAIAAPISQ